MTMPAVAILCGGLATRLGPLAADTPKSLIPVAGRPFIFYQLDLLRRNGFRDVVLCVGHLGDKIRDCVGDGREQGLDIRYSFDGGTRLGTAGALKKAAGLLGEAFLVMYGDSYLDCDYQAVFAAFERSGKDALMTVYRNQGNYDASNAVFRDDEITVYNKKRRTPDMEYIDYGLGVFAASAFTGFPDNQTVDLADIYSELLTRNRLAGFEVMDRFYEIGSVMGLAEFAARVRADKDASYSSGSTT